jgi:hypothetical protein
MLLAFSTVSLSPAPLLLLYTISNALKAHFESLHEKIRALSKDSSEISVKDIVEYHWKIEDWVRELNDIYSPIINASFIYYSFFICNAGFQVIVVSDCLTQINERSPINTRNLFKICKIFVFVLMFRNY